MSTRPSTLARGLHKHLRREIAATPTAYHRDARALARAIQKKGALICRHEDVWLVMYLLIEPKRAAIGAIRDDGTEYLLALEISQHALLRFFDKYPERANLRQLTDEFRPLVRAMVDGAWDEGPTCPTLTGEARLKLSQDGDWVVTTWLHKDSLHLEVTT